MSAACEYKQKAGQQIDGIPRMATEKRFCFVKCEHWRHGDKINRNRDRLSVNNDSLVYKKAYEAQELHTYTLNVQPRYFIFTGAGPITLSISLHEKNAHSLPKSRFTNTYLLHVLTSTNE